MTYDIGTMVLSHPYYVGNHPTVPGWIITCFTDFYIVEWADPSLPTSLVIPKDMAHIHQLWLDLQNANS